MRLTGYLYVPTLQVEVRDHRHPGGGCEAPSPHVVMAAHSPSPTDGKTLPRALQDQNHKQETQRGAAQGTRGGGRAELNV